MFSCVLVHACEKADENSTGAGPGEDVLVAESVALDVQVVSNAGRGTAECTYLLGRALKDVVACVPSTICVKDASTQQVKVTKCHIEVHREGMTPHTSSLQLTKLDSDYHEHAKGLPNYGCIKKSLRRAVTPDDLILYLGHFEPSTSIVLKFEFLLQLKMPTRSVHYSPLCHTFEDSISAKHTQYKLRLASHLPVTNVSPSPSISLTGFNWFHTDRTKQVIHVSYSVDQNEEEERKGVGFSIELAQSHNQSACCSCLVQTNVTASGHKLEQLHGKYDGMMMLSSRLTKEQILAGSKRHIFPSEFVFLVDCSASMNQFIDSAIATLITSIKSLPQGCYFNLIAFGSSFRQLFHESKEYSKSSVKNAVDFANQLKASLGGTELLPPLKWIYRKTRKSEMPCQIFVITDVDQEVKDCAYMLSTIKKHRDQARCHTFGIGSGICESLVTSIAEVSGGRSVILPEGDRLQTKVMEVLKESLNPFLMDTEIRWHPPQGYSVVDSTPKSLGTLYCHQTRLAFAFLRRTDADTASNHRDSCNGTSQSPATILGSLHGMEVRVPIEEAILPPLSPPQVEELASLLKQVGQWSKLDELEVARLLSVSRKNSTEDEGEETGEKPRAKRPRLNGDVTGSGTGNCHSATPSSLSSAPAGPIATGGEIQRDLLNLSLESGIPCPFTYLRTSCSDGREVLQALPYKRPTLSVSGGKNGVTLHRPKRRRRHNGPQGHAPQDGVSRATALAKSTISVVGSSIMNFVSMFHSDSSPSLLEAEDGKTIEDEVELQNHKGNQLFWDENRGEIKYPATYYHNSSNHHHHHHLLQNGGSKSTSSSASSSPTNHGSHVTRPHPHHTKDQAPTNGYSRHHNHQMQNTGMACQTATPLSSHCHSPSQPAVPTSSHRHSPSRPDQRYVVDTSSSSDDEEDSFGISDSESDSSVELDWETLPKTREYLPLMQMQLFSGGWPIGHEFSYAIRVPMGEIGKLPLLGQQKQQKPAPAGVKQMTMQNSISCVVGSASQEEEELAHFWTTALAVACFRECFPQFEEEWELIVRKGEEWLDRNLNQCALSKGQIQTTAKELLFRKY